MKVYQAKYAKKENVFDALKEAEEIQITSYPWNEDYQPKSTAKLVWTDDAFYYEMSSLEKKENIRAVEEGISGFVHTDSCLEFFFSPLPDSRKEYINIEINPNAATHIEVGPNRQERCLRTDIDLAILETKTFMVKEGEMIRWGFSAKVPYTLVEKLMEVEDFYPSAYMRANFYKCGNKTPEPHYGIWNDIETENPDYHRPEFFGRVEFVK
jgi:hypothetical protein